MAFSSLGKAVKVRLGFIFQATPHIPVARSLKKYSDHEVRLFWLIIGDIMTQVKHLLIKEMVIIRPMSNPVSFPPLIAYKPFTWSRFSTFFYFYLYR